MLYGMDISKHKREMKLSTIDKEFFILKASEGIHWKNVETLKLFDTLKEGQLYGFYHFPQPDLDAPEDAARYFIRSVGHHAGNALFALYWEPGKGCDGMVEWAHRWLSYVFLKTGVRPVIFMNQFIENSFDWSPIVNDEYDLWIANYGNNDGRECNYTLKHWHHAILHQYTSESGIDYNVFYGNLDEWKEKCRIVRDVPPIKKKSKKLHYRVGDEVTTSVLATTCLGGDVYEGLWTETIVKVIKGASYPYLLDNSVGWTNETGIVNSFDTIHIVEKGDTLAKIAANYSVNYRVLAEYNNIENPNIIEVGQKIKIPK